MLVAMHREKHVETLVVICFWLSAVRRRKVQPAGLDVWEFRCQILPPPGSVRRRRGYYSSHPGSLLGFLCIRRGFWQSCWMLAGCWGLWTNTPSSEKICHGKQNLMIDVPIIGAYVYTSTKIIQNYQSQWWWTSTAWSLTHAHTFPLSRLNWEVSWVSGSSPASVTRGGDPLLGKGSYHH